MIKNGALGELAAMKHFLQDGYEVYAAVTDSSTYDMLVAKDGLVLKVEVKTTSTRQRAGSAWSVQLKSVRSNKTQNKIVNFDNTKVDFLVVYVAPLDRIHVFKAYEVTQTTMMLIPD